jgi:hypothetical protein|tara:strand:+ start:2645 stop:2809 length:165 start_codon:yes stop_codon:yes gene_type:complete
MKTKVQEMESLLTLMEANLLRLRILLEKEKSKDEEALAPKSTYSAKRQAGLYYD